MSMSRMRRKRRLIKKMEMLGYDFADTQGFIREAFDMSHAAPVGMRFKANAILAPLLEAMKHKYRVLENHYDDGSVWFMPQVGDWWHGWRYICERHPCPEVDLQRLAYKTFEEADAYMRGFIERDKNGTTIPARHCCKWPATVIVHDYAGDCQS